jgi:hypothetical protein
MFLILLSNFNTLQNDNTSMDQLQIASLVILGGITLYLLLSDKNNRSFKIPEPQSLNQFPMFAYKKKYELHPIS